MTNDELKIYTSKAVELEVAIYTQKLLLRKHQDLILEKRPQKPTIKKITEPRKPDVPNSEMYIFTGQGCASALSSSVCLLMGIFLAIWGPFKLIPVWRDSLIEKLSGAIPGIIMILISLVFFRVFYKAKQCFDNNEEAQFSAYRQKMENYEKSMEIYRNNVIEAEKNYNDLLIKYDNDIEEYDANSKDLLDKHYATLELLEQSLQDFYSDNIIFEKYRNLVAITAIDEYLRSGRCFELEGPNGAYNLYEMELRQNIIIGHLAVIIDNLEQIRSNQFSLYEELNKANNTVKQIVYELKDLNNTSKLTAYFAQAAAIAASAPRIYRTYTF